MKILSFFILLFLNTAVADSEFGSSRYICKDFYNAMDLESGIEINLYPTLCKDALVGMKKNSVCKDLYSILNLATGNITRIYPNLCKDVL